MLAEAGLTTALFAELYGTTVQRVMWWIDGRDKKGNLTDVPHPAYLLLKLMIEDPSNIDRLESYTKAMTTKRKEAKASA
jgi:DNA-binding transcriptional regulator YiaG